MLSLVPECSYKFFDKNDYLYSRYTIANVDGDLVVVMGCNLLCRSILLFTLLRRYSFSS